jgi:hypothetical protein
MRRDLNDEVFGKGSVEAPAELSTTHFCWHVIEQMDGCPQPSPSDYLTTR